MSKNGVDFTAVSKIVIYYVVRHPPSNNKGVTVLGHSVDTAAADNSEDPNAEIAPKCGKSAPDGEAKDPLVFIADEKSVEKRPDIPYSNSAMLSSPKADGKSGSTGSAGGEPSICNSGIVDKTDAENDTSKTVRTECYKGINYTGAGHAKGHLSKLGVAVILAVYDLYNTTIAGRNDDDTVAVANVTKDSKGGTVAAENGKTKVPSESLTVGPTLDELSIIANEKSENVKPLVHESGVDKSTDLPTISLPSSSFATLSPRTIIKGAPDVENRKTSRRVEIPNNITKYKTTQIGK